MVNGFACKLPRWRSLLLVLCLLVLPVSASAFVAIQHYTVGLSPARGYIYSIAEVLSEAGDPYWVSSTSEDKVADKCGETTGNKAPKKVTVIGGATRRNYNVPWVAIELSKLSPELPTARPIRLRVGKMPDFEAIELLLTLADEDQ